jgi:hypothetical protein
MLSATVDVIHVTGTVRIAKRVVLKEAKQWGTCYGLGETRLMLYIIQ